MARPSLRFKKTIKEAAFKSVFGLFPKEFVLGRLFDLEEILRYVSSSEIVFKLARTPEEHEAAARLTYEAYIAQKMMPENHLNKRISKYNLSPGTFTVIAVKRGESPVEDEVVATVSLINDSGLGLPSDSIADLSSKRRGNVVAEVGSLCVKKEFRSSKGKILIPMMKYLAMVANQLNVDTFICTVHPQATSFYEVLFDAKYLPQKHSSYVCGTNELPAKVMSINCDFLSLGKLAKDKSSPALRRQVCEYYVTQSEEPYFIVEDFRLKVREDVSFDRDYGKVLMKEYLELGGELSDEDYRVLTSMLRDMTVCADEVFRKRVKEHRVLTAFLTTINIKGIGHVTCRTIDSSFSGLKLSVERVFSEKELEMFITYAPGMSVHLKGQVMWQRQYVVGIKIEGGQLDLWKQVIGKALREDQTIAA
ncbi:MAG: hypothetical protein CME64_13180 [Halobacteriovoraceae bacterium]|nr:hypothetical protein [Halobacteriovoraceae bacterium]|tara:strand:- start:58425 stop:59687 length:1263 start_codon:yes stop_codon:yes gene_type:complete